MENFPLNIENRFFHWDFTFSAEGRNEAKIFAFAVHFYAFLTLLSTSRMRVRIFDFIMMSIRKIQPVEEIFVILLQVEGKINFKCKFPATDWTRKLKFWAFALNLQFFKVSRLHFVDFFISSFKSDSNWVSRCCRSTQNRLLSSAASFQFIARLLELKINRKSIKSAVEVKSLATTRCWDVKSYKSGSCAVWKKIKIHLCVVVDFLSRSHSPTFESLLLLINYKQQHAKGRERDGKSFFSVEWQNVEKTRNFDPTNWKFSKVEEIWDFKEFLNFLTCLEFLNFLTHNRTEQKIWKFHQNLTKFL